MDRGEKYPLPQRLSTIIYSNQLVTVDFYRQSTSVCFPLTRGRIWHRRAGCALHPARKPLELLLRRKAENPLVFASQYQQRPVPVQGNTIEAACFQYHKPGSVNLRHGQIVQSWDTAYKDNPFIDWSVCVTRLVQGKPVYVIDVFRVRLQFHKLPDSRKTYPGLTPHQSRSAFSFVRAKLSAIHAEQKGIA